MPSYRIFRFDAAGTRPVGEPEEFASADAAAVALVRRVTPTTQILSAADEHNRLVAAALVCPETEPGGRPLVSIMFADGRTGQAKILAFKADGNDFVPVREDLNHGSAPWWDAAQPPKSE